MPVVVGGGILPREIARPKWYADVGYAQGRTIGKIEDAILAMLLGGGQIGRVPTQPTPQRPGQLQFPSGAMTNTSPDELAQLQAMGGVPNRQGGIVPFGTGAPNAVSYQPPTKLGIRPNLDWQAKELANQKARQALDPNSPENRILSTQAGYWDILRKNEEAKQQPPSGSPMGDFDALRIIADEADAGNPTSKAVMEYILSRKK